jgi:hypothetical protein
LHYFLAFSSFFIAFNKKKLDYFLHFSSHSTRKNQNIALFPCIFFICHLIQQETFKKLHYFLAFSSFFIAFNKKHSKNCIIFFIFHRI